MSDLIPMMFRAQIEGRCQVQRLISENRRQDADEWVDEWVEGVGDRVPSFGKDVRTQEYAIAWRFVSNSGQDEKVIYPVMGARGWPYYPGASMKGAFLRACWAEQAEGNILEEKVLLYCGGEVPENGTKTTKPGILRFHGGYPKNDNWKKRDLGKKRNLVDVVHPQENWQVTGENEGEHSAMIQISLYKPVFVFGISLMKQLHHQSLSEDEWKTIWRIWDRAIGRGIGCRVSAGYGLPKSPKDRSFRKQNTIISIGLSGKGICSQLINKKPEFRPNMFKAALRGHTLRLFSGVTDEATAIALTEELWGGFASSDSSIVGLLGIGFDDMGIGLESKELEIYNYVYYNKNNKRVVMPRYDLKNGKLSILAMRDISEKERKHIKTFLSALIKFAMLLGGFGKSWRRAYHEIFFPKYLINPFNKNENHQPMIGVHWGFTELSQHLYCPVNELSDITNFLDNLYNKKVKGWVNKLRGRELNSVGSNFREAWHPDKVQVWARLAENELGSEAIFWFHKEDDGNPSIKKSILTGWAADNNRKPHSQISRIWHRMYPHFEGEDSKNLEPTGKYVEILTIFPDLSATGDRRDQQNNFLNFLQTTSTFTKVWPKEEN